MAQMTKRFGLMKLKKIAGEPNSKWFVSPHIVLQSPEQLRKARIGSAERLLVRTDERGKRYNYHFWDQMTRFDMEAKDAEEQLIQKIYWGAYGKRVLLIHPTRKREEIAYSGSIIFQRWNQKCKVEFSLTKNPPLEMQIHRHLDATFKAELSIKNGKLETKKVTHWSKSSKPKILNFWKKLFGQNNPAAEAPEEQILAHVKEFVEKGLLANQIKSRKIKTEIFFVTWKDAPTKVEFYDLQENR